jgi:hypothetical protein
MWVCDYIVHDSKHLGHHDLTYMELHSRNYIRQTKILAMHALWDWLALEVMPDLTTGSHEYRVSLHQLGNTYVSMDHEYRVSLRQLGNKYVSMDHTSQRWSN